MQIQCWTSVAEDQLKGVIAGGHRLYINMLPIAADHVYQTTRESRPAVSLLLGQYGIKLSTSRKHASQPRQHPASITATPADTRR